MSGLVVEGLAVEIDGTRILHGAGLTAPKGKVTGLIGPNGAGKSTLFAALLGIRRPGAGTITLMGDDLQAMRRDERARRAAYVPQSAATEERLTVRDVVSLGRIAHQSGWGREESAEDAAIVARALAQTGMQGFAGRQYDTLSGGERQAVQIARALAQQPTLLLLDEPTSNLDLRAQLAVHGVMRELADDGAVVMAILHDLNQAARFCDHLVLLSQGRVIAEGTPAEVLKPELLGDVYGVGARILADPATSSPIIIHEMSGALQNRR